MKTKIFGLFAAAAILFSGCSEDVLDRPQKVKPDDDNYWVNETNLRLYANEYYYAFFNGYNTGYTIDYTPLRGYTFSDDIVTSGTQTLFETSIPDVRGSNNNTTNASGTITTPEWLSEYAGPTWYFAWIRKSNFMLDRMEKKMKPILTEEAYKHWSGIATFFRALEYSRMSGTFGTVPYFNELLESNSYDLMYKDRTPWGELWDGIYNDYKFAMDNVRQKDDAQSVDKYVVAGFVSRWMLYAGTWAKYQQNDTERAKKYLQLSKEAADYLMTSGKYKIESPFHTLFGSEDLSGNKECIIYRHYDATQGVTHHIASYSNGIESQPTAPNLSLIKAFICNDGNVWQNSSEANVKEFDIANLIKTRDPRFEATFWNKPRTESASLLYASKFIDRTGPAMVDRGEALPAKYISNTNTNDYPVLRYSEVLLNWIEAKAELATLGGAAVNQGDIEASINEIRNRPLDAVAIERGVKKTASMQLAALPNDPARDADVSALIWEIRRERRMEFVFEHSRLLDIKRWKKLNYMSGAANPDNLKGVWVNIQNEAPSLLTKVKEGLLKVQKADGTIVTYNGSNAADLVGYYLPEKVADRDAFTNRSYLSPVAKGQIDLYQTKGYTLTQTTGW